MSHSETTSGERDHGLAASQGNAPLDICLQSSSGPRNFRILRVFSSFGQNLLRSARARNHDLDADQVVTVRHIGVLSNL